MGSSSTDIVIAGPDAISTAKVVAAKAKGTQIWSEADFNKKVGGKAPMKVAAKAKGKVAAKAKGMVKKTMVKKTMAMAKAKVKARVRGAGGAEKSGGKLAGKVIVITGTMSKKRKEIEKTIKQHGGKIVNSVTKAATHIL